MRFTDADLTCIADDTVEHIEKALYELKGVKEYEEYYIALDDIKYDLLSTSQPYRENYYHELDKERAYENHEYESSRL